MDADLKRLEDKITTLISLCTSLRDENAKLRDDLNHAHQNTATLKNNMLLASQKLEVLLEKMPAETTPSDDDSL